MQIHSDCGRWPTCKWLNSRKSAAYCPIALKFAAWVHYSSMRLWSRSVVEFVDSYIIGLAGPDHDRSGP